MGRTSSVQGFKVSNKIQEELESVKTELAKAIKKEEFEEAATLRDKVKFLEKFEHPPGDFCLTLEIMIHTTTATLVMAFQNKGKLESH